jgi:hypothetical protein
MTVLALAQLVSPVVKYPRWKAAKAPITNQTNSKSPPMLLALLLLRVLIHANYPGCASACRALIHLAVGAKQCVR